MYSVVLAAMLTTGAQAPDWGHGCWGCYGCHGCYGCSCFGCHGCWGCHGCHGCSCYGCHGYAFSGCSCYGCYGCSCYGCSCYGCYGCSCFGCSCYGCYGCHSYSVGCYCSGCYCSGCYCSGGYVYAVPAYAYNYSHAPSVVYVASNNGYSSAYPPAVVNGNGYSQAPVVVNGNGNGSARPPVIVNVNGNGKANGNGKGGGEANPSTEAEREAVRDLLRRMRSKGNGKDDESRWRAPAPARVSVRLPSDAKLWVNDVACPLTSARRSFTTPQLRPGQRYAYTLRAEVERDGRRVTQTQRVNVAAGRQVDVRFDFTSELASTGR